MSRFHSEISGGAYRRWQRVRRQVLRRDKYRCTHCGKASRLEVDHITPLSRGGARFDLANLRSLCREHHLAKSLQERGIRPQPPGAAAWRRFVSELA